MAEQVKIDKAEYEKAMAILSKQATAKQKEKVYWARQAILVKKAVAAGLTVTDAEINEYVKNMKTRTK